MLELLDFDRLEEILVLIIPGLVSLKVWTLINISPTARLKIADYLLDIITFSTLNFVALSWLSRSQQVLRCGCELSSRSACSSPLPLYGLCCFAGH